MPSSEDWLTQSLGRIKSYEMHISPNLQKILLPHTLMRKPSIPRKVPTEVTTIQNLCQQQSPTLLIHWHYHLILRQSKLLLQNIPPANFHNPRCFSSLCTTSKAVEAEEPIVEAELTEVKKELTEVKKELAEA